MKSVVCGGGGDAVQLGELIKVCCEFAGFIVVFCQKKASSYFSVHPKQNTILFFNASM